MTENKALILDAVVGCLITWGSVVILNAVGANGGLQGVAGVLGLVGMSFMVGVIGDHYEGKGTQRVDDRKR
jgi:hypothetical protein